VGAARRLEAHPLLRDKPELYNLAADIGETKNLAAEKAELASELNALIAGFLKDTEAVVPVRNSTFQAKPAAVKDPLLGWKARACDATVKDGIVTVTGKGETPFLGFAAGKTSGPAILKFRVRTTAGGVGKVEWLPTPQVAAKSVAFQITAGGWQEVSVQIPPEGALGILRLYLPAQKDSVRLDWIELDPAGGKPQRSDF
jgi:hypothetical protein